MRAIHHIQLCDHDHDHGRLHYFTKMDVLVNSNRYKRRMTVWNNKITSSECINNKISRLT